MTTEFEARSRLGDSDMWTPWYPVPAGDAFKMVGYWNEHANQFEMRPVAPAALTMQQFLDAAVAAGVARVVFYKYRAWYCRTDDIASNMTEQLVTMAKILGAANAP